MATAHDNDGLIHEPAFIQIDLLNNTKISGRAMAYSDPDRSTTYGAFVSVDRDGVRQYVLWAAILRLSVFPLGTEPADAEDSVSASLKDTP